MGFATLTRQIAAGSDDTSGKSGAYSNASLQQRIGRDTVSGSNTGFRFTNITIPPGAKIESAYIRFTAKGNTGPITVNNTIKAEASAAPVTYGATEDPTARSYRATTVTYNFSNDSWVGGTQYLTPDMRSMIIDLISAYGPYSGGVMAFSVQYVSGTNGNYHDAESYDDVPLSSAVLIINYYTGPGILLSVIQENLTEQTDGFEPATQIIQKVSGNVYLGYYVATNSVYARLFTCTITPAGAISAAITTLVDTTADRSGQYDDMLATPHPGIFVRAASGAGQNGWVYSIQVALNGSSIAYLNSLEINANNCQMFRLIHIAGDVYAALYNDNTAGNPRVITTFSCDNSGNLAAIQTVKETLAFAFTMGDIIKVGPGVYAVLCGNSAANLRLETIAISDAGAIGAVIASTATYWGDRLLKIAGQIFACFAPTTGVSLSTVNISADGTTISAPIATATVDPNGFGNGFPRHFVYLGSQVWALYYATTFSSANHSFLRTYQINADGSIGGSVDTHDFSADGQNGFPYCNDAIFISGTTTAVFALIYVNAASGSDAGSLRLRTVSFTANLPVPPAGGHNAANLLAGKCI